MIIRVYGDELEIDSAFLGGEWLADFADLDMLVKFLEGVGSGVRLELVRGDCAIKVVTPVTGDQLDHLFFAPTAVEIDPPDPPGVLYMDDYEDELR